MAKRPTKRGPLSPPAGHRLRLGVVLALAALLLAGPAVALAASAPARPDARSAKPGFGSPASGAVEASAWQTGTVTSSQAPLAWDFSWMPQWAIYDTTVNVSNVLWLFDAVLLGTCRFLVTFRTGLGNSTGYLVAGLFRQLAPFYLALGTIAALGWAALIFARYFTRFRISAVDRLALVVALVFLLAGSGPSLLQAFEGLRGFMANLTYTLAVRSFGGEPVSTPWCSLNTREDNPQLCSGYKVALGYAGLTDEAALAVTLPPAVTAQFFESNGVPVNSSWFADQDKEARDRMLAQVQQAPLYLLEEGGLALRAVVEEFVWTLLGMATVALLAALAFALMFAAFIPAGDLVGNIFRLSLELFMLTGWTGLVMGAVMGVTRPWLTSPADHVLDLLGAGLFASVLYAWVGVAAGQIIVRAFRTFTSSVTVEVTNHWPGTSGAGAASASRPSYARLPAPAERPQFTGAAARGWRLLPEAARGPDMPALPGKAMVTSRSVSGDGRGTHWFSLESRAPFIQLPPAATAPEAARADIPGALGRSGVVRVHVADPSDAPASAATEAIQLHVPVKTVSLTAPEPEPLVADSAAKWSAVGPATPGGDMRPSEQAWQAAALAAYRSEQAQPAEAWLSRQPAAHACTDQINWLVASAQAAALPAAEFVAALESVAARADGDAHRILSQSAAGEARMSAAQSAMWLRQAAQVLSTERQAE